MNNQHGSYFQLAVADFRKNRLAMFCVLSLGLLYFAAVFADFLAPYSYREENRAFSYCRPTAVRLFDEKGRLRRPFVYGIKVTFDSNHKRVYQVNTSVRYPLKIFIKSEPHKILGLVPCSRRLFGVSQPGRLYLWGADSRGRDLFSRIIYGGRVSLFIGLIGVAISFSIGLMVGGIAGYFGGKTDDILMRICEMFMLIPEFYLLLALRAVVPPDFNSLKVFIAIVVILAFIGWAGLARVIRGMCLSLREREFVLAAKAMGLSDLKIIIRHILPHTLSYSIAAIMLSIPSYIIMESALSLLGLGIQDPFASWGNLLSEAMSIIQVKFAPWILLPGLFIFIAVMCFNVIGDVLRDCLDPRLKTGKSV